MRARQWFAIAAWVQPALPRLALLFVLAVSPILAQAATNGPASSDEMPVLRPPRGEIPPTFWELHSAAVVIGGVCLAAAVGAVIWFLTRPKPQVPTPPEVIARHELETLRQEPESGAILSRVSQILRRYVGSAFNLPPEELTTAEFCRVLTADEKVGVQVASRVGDFLRRCDYDKFSPPGPREPFGAVARAAELVDLAEARRAELRAQEIAAAAASAQAGQGTKNHNARQAGDGAA